MSERPPIATVTDFQPELRFPLVCFDKILLSSTAAYLVKGLVPREGLVVVWGPSKCGKTFFCFDIAMHIALNWEYRGRRVVPGTVVYVACEGERGLAARVAAFRNERMAEDVEGVPPFYLLTTRLDLAADVDTLISEIRLQLGDGGCAAVVIDTLNRSLVGSESSDEYMAAYIKAADAIRETFNCAIIIIHHCGVEDRRPRGHTSLTGAADAQIAVRKDDLGNIVATVEYLKDGEAGAEIISTLRVVDLGMDECGEIITSCIIAPAAGTAPSRKVASRPKGPAKIALDLLTKALDADGEAPPASNHIPPNISRVLSEDAWRRWCYTGSISTSDKLEAKQKAFKRAADALQGAELIGVWGGWVWKA